MSEKLPGIRIPRSAARLGVLLAALGLSLGAAQAQSSEKAAAASKTADVAGRYAVMRADKDTGCMVTLDEKARGPKGSLKANLAPACRDQGIVIFDPVGWQMVNGRLVLTARKGHTTHLDQGTDGTWVKDPKEGKTMGLKRL